jgi:hypothetical protein
VKEEVKEGGEDVYPEIDIDIFRVCHDDLPRKEGGWGKRAST